MLLCVTMLMFKKKYWLTTIMLLISSDCSLFFISGFQNLVNLAAVTVPWKSIDTLRTFSHFLKLQQQQKNYNKFNLYFMW